MPRCKYCGKEPFLTYCPSYYYHIESCRQSAEGAEARAREAKQELEALKRQQEQDRLLMEERMKWQAREAELIRASRSQVTNIYIQTMVVQMNTLYLDYPRDNLTQQILHDAHSCDISLIESEEDLKVIRQSIAKRNDGEITKYIAGNDKRAHSQVLSLFADVFRILRERIQKESERSSARLWLIQNMENFEQGCLKSKQRFEEELLKDGPTVEGID